MASTNSLYGKSDVLKSEFSFLQEKYGFEIIDERNPPYGAVVDYQKDDIRVKLYFEFKDYFFSFHIIKGKNTQFPNDQDKENIRDISEIVSKYNVPNITTEDLQPNRSDGYERALKLNAELLQKYGDGILKGQEWF